MRMIDKSEECLGKHIHRIDAETLAEAETERTGKKHHPFLTHYNCPYTFENKMHWTIIRTKGNAT